MPIKEISFRIGCGRYIQEPGAVKRVGAEVTRLGHAPLVVGGRTALGLTRAAMEESVKACCARWEIVEHTGTCNEERAKELAEFAKEKGYDVIVGTGGGVIMDFAKLIGYFAGLPVINIPTSSATCAAYTPMSVCYTPEGRTVGTRHYDYEVNAVLADTAIIAKQPVRLLMSGIFDALAKFVEISQRYDADAADNPLGLDWAYVLAKHSYALLVDKAEKCIADMKAGQITADVENVIFTAIAATGVISGIARGSNQCALAHKFYETTRVVFYETARPHLHGEIVGVGLLLQNHFNGNAAENENLRGLMAKYGMPSRVGDVGITASAESMEEYYQRLKASSAANYLDEAGLSRLHASLDYFWNL